ncbi:MAG: CdaR family protein [Bacilli bacterium]|nr:CdaR family protein [Bacilli bacterium]
MNKAKYIFKKILRFFDKIIIIPITKSFMWISKKLKLKGKSFEKLISKKGSLIIVSLAVSLAVFFFVDNKTIILLETSADVIYSQKVNAIYNEEAYVIEGLPETVDITLIGRKSDLYLAKQLPSYEVTVDLKSLKQGTHKVSLKYKGAIDTINYKLDPSVASITIYSKVSEVRSVNVDILNEDKLNTKLSISSVNLDSTDIIIKGAQYKLNEVAIVKALVDINSIPNIDVGTITLEDIPLIAYDQTGNVIDVEIVPSTVNADILVQSPKKTLPIKVVPVGTPAFGKAIKTIDTSVESVTVYGDQTILDNMSFVEVNVNIEGISEARKTTVTIEKPSGIRFISSNSTEIDITLDGEITKEFENIQLEYTNLSELYNAYAGSMEDQNVTVIVKGVSSVIETLDASTIKAYIDLKGYTQGTHEVEVKVEGSDLRLSYLPKVKKVSVILSSK